jgi:hypothetical protein
MTRLPTPFDSYQTRAILAQREAAFVDLTCIKLDRSREGRMKCSRAIRWEVRRGDAGDPFRRGAFPSNYLFIAYGLSGLPLRVIGAAFFLGRTVSYAAWGHLGRFASAHVEPESQLGGGYLSGYFVITQLALLGLVYILMKLDWKMLIEQRKLTWRRSLKPPDDVEHRHTTDH